MSMDTIIVALITGAVSLLVSLITANAQHNKTVSLIAYRIEQLEKKQEKHNNIVERMYKVENDLNTAWHRIDELKEK
ncbi:MAG: hypothetical protein HUJ95_00185 [Bacteroidales bacterium]|nr:hypothetical protein [Bacteroidales bacterium]